MAKSMPLHLIALEQKPCISNWKQLSEYVRISEKVIGKGSTGNVYEGSEVLKNGLGNTKVAIKVIDLATIDN